MSPLGFLRRFYRMYGAIAIARKFKQAGVLVPAWYENGGVLGDLAAYAHLRPDLIPSTDRIAPRTPIRTALPFDQIRPIIIRELGRSLAECFLSISHIPVSSDRISQTHRATLHNGTQALVTIIIPAYSAQDRADLAMLRSIARLIRIPGAQIRPLIDAFTALHFRSGIRRGRELEALASRISTSVRVPGVIWSHTTPHILTTTYIQAVPLDMYMNDVNRQGPVRIQQSRDVRLLAQQSLNTYVHVGLIQGVVGLTTNAHTFSISSDGRLNLLRTPVGYLKPLERGHCIAIIKAIVTRDVKTIGRSLIMLGTVRQDMILPRYQAALDEILALHYGKPSGIMNTLYGLFRCALSNGITVRDDVIRFIASLRDIEYVIGSLLPDGADLHVRVQMPLRIDRFRTSRSNTRTMDDTMTRARTESLVQIDIPAAPVLQPALTQALGIVTASLFLGSALLAVTLPLGAVSLGAAGCFFGLGCGSGLTLWRTASPRRT